MIPRGRRGDHLYAEALKIAGEGGDVATRCQEIAALGMRSGLSQKAAYRHIARALQKALTRYKTQR